VRSYDQCAFKLHLPTVTQYENLATFSYQFVYRQGNTEKIVFYRAELIDRVGNRFEANNQAVFFSNAKKQYVASFEVINAKGKIFINKSNLNMYFLSDNDEKTKVSFEFDLNGKAKLLDVSKLLMSDIEKNAFISTFHRYTNNENGTTSSENAGSYSSGSSSQNGYHGSGYQTSYDATDLPGLERYKKALQEEKYFLKHEGGRQYKVTNGKLVENSKGIYSYIFDLETELHLSDDAPISISTGVTQTTGTVLMCEDFQIIVLLEANIGERVGTAHIRVEPWKLLEAIENRLQYAIGVKGAMASKILKDGPAQATNQPIDKIEKGQNAVIERAMKEPVTIVWGPPGTGKTHTMSELAIKFLAKGESVLIVSHSNVSVDGVAKKIDELLRKYGKERILQEGKVLRYGYVRDEELNKNEYVNSFYYTVKKNPSLSQKLDHLQEEYDKIKHTNGLASQRIIGIRKEISKIRSQIREEEQGYVGKAKIVATTISKVVIDKIFEDRQFGAVMFDEVSMAYVLQVVCAATFAKNHLICVGDFMQLAPIAQSKAKKILCEDIFTYLGINVNGKPYYHPWLVMLDEQRRMHPKISAFSNKYVYNRLLKDHISVYTSRKSIVETELFSMHAINLIDLSGSYCAASKNADNSRFNILSALISFSSALNTERNVRNISIITPYAAQTRLIRALVLDYRQHGETNIRCATVHQFQGSESDVVFFDAVESYPGKKPGWLMGKDFDSILRLINVAVTRAKGKLVTVANTRFWNNNFSATSHTFYRLISYIENDGNLIKHAQDRSLEKLISTLTVKGGPQYYSEPEQYIELLCTDLVKAKVKIVISLPSGELFAETESKIFHAVSDAKKKGIQVLIKTNGFASLPESWKEYTWGTDNAIFPLIVIDDRITWYGVPQAPWKFVDGNNGYGTVCHIICRIVGEHTAEIIRSLSELEYRETAGQKTPLTARDNGAKVDEDNHDDGMQLAGLAAYVSETRKCTHCRKPLVMLKGKSGKTILWCKECKKTELLSPEEINHYIYLNHVKCPHHKCDVEAKLGKYGLYIRCDSGHYLKPEEI
jgi:hypothetical protein